MEFDIEAIKWLIDMLETDIKPFEASANLVKQTRTYHCKGCDGVFVSKYPVWKIPDNDFPHKNNCKYISAINLLMRLSNAH